MNKRSTANDRMRFDGARRDRHVLCDRWALYPIRRGAFGLRSVTAERVPLQSNQNHSSGTRRNDQDPQDSGRPTRRQIAMEGSCLVLRRLPHMCVLGRTL